MNFAKRHSGSCKAVNGGTEISQISFNLLKMNESLTGLERDESE